MAFNDSVMVASGVHAMRRFFPETFALDEVGSQSFVEL